MDSRQLVDVGAGVDRFLLDLLPVRSARQLADQLAALCLRMTKCRAAFVFFCLNRETTFLGALAEAESDTRPVEFELGAPGVGGSGVGGSGHEDDITAALVDQLGFEDLQQWQQRVVPFASAGLARGCLILFSAESEALELGQIEDLAACCASTAAQAALLRPLRTTTIDPEGTMNSEKLQAMAELAAGAGHEINNPLATISGRAQLLLQTETDPARRQALATIGGQAHRVRDMIGDLMLFARPPEPNPERLDLAETVRSVLQKLTEPARARKCSFQFEADSEVPVWADRAQLPVVISSLARNSLEASPEGGKIVVTVHRARENGRAWAQLEVTDEGSGFGQLDRVHAFDPFYSGRQAGRGLGFGLSKCWRIVTNHNGRIDIDSAPDNGTRLRVLWPAENGEAVAAPAR